MLLLFVPVWVWSYEAPEDREDVFAKTACPAFLTFMNAAYISGTTVELPCLCKPQEVQTVVWFYTKHTTGSQQMQALSDHHGLKVVDSGSVLHGSDLRSRFSIRMFSLIVFRTSPADSGVYICGSEHKDFFYAYDVDIQETRKINFADSPGQRRRPQRGSGPEPLFRTFTSFQAWSVCDRCDAPGEQVRVGLCYVHSPYLHVRYQRANQTVTSCGSGAVLRVFGPIRSEGAVLEVRRCSEVCPTPPPTPTKMASLMAFLEYGSKSRPVGVEVFYLSHRADTILTLGCPGAKPNMAVAWDKDETPILRWKHTAPPGGELPRISIDTGHHLIFSPAQTDDSGVYHCWLEGQRAALIRLLVYSHLGQSQSVLSHPDFYPALRTLLWFYAGMTTAFLLMLVTKATVQTIRDRLEMHQDQELD